MGSVLILLALNICIVIESCVLREAHVLSFVLTVDVYNTKDLKNSCVARSSVEDWFISNFRSLNVAKSESTDFRSTEIQSSESVKFLGVVLDVKLTWQHHSQYIGGKLENQILLLCSLKHMVPLCVVAGFSCLFEPLLRYAVLAWGHAAAVEDMLSLQSVSFCFYT